MVTQGTHYKSATSGKYWLKMKCSMSMYVYYSNVETFSNCAEKEWQGKLKHLCSNAFPVIGAHS